MQICIAYFLMHTSLLEVLRDAFQLLHKKKAVVQVKHLSTAFIQKNTFFSLLLFCSAKIF